MTQLGLALTLVTITWQLSCACEPVQFSDVCDIQREICYVHPNNCDFNTVQLVYNVLTAHDEAGYTIMVNPYNITGCSRISDTACVKPSTSTPHFTYDGFISRFTIPVTITTLFPNVAVSYNVPLGVSSIISASNVSISNIHINIVSANATDSVISRIASSSSATNIGYFTLEFGQSTLDALTIANATFIHEHGPRFTPILFDNLIGTPVKIKRTRFTTVSATTTNTHSQEHDETPQFLIAIGQYSGFVQLQNIEGHIIHYPATDNGGTPMGGLIQIGTNALVVINVGSVFSTPIASHRSAPDVLKEILYIFAPVIVIVFIGLVMKAIGTHRPNESREQ